MNKQTRDQLVTECSTDVLASIVNGNLKEAIEKIIDKAIAWEKNQTSGNVEILLNEKKEEACTPIVPNNSPAIKPAEVGSKVTSSPEPANGPKGAPVGNKVTTGWGNPFGGTSWGV